MIPARRWGVRAIINRLFVASGPTVDRGSVLLIGGTAVAPVARGEDSRRKEPYVLSTGLGARWLSWAIKRFREVFNKDEGKLLRARAGVHGSSGFLGAGGQVRGPWSIRALSVIVYRV